MCALPHSTGKPFEVIKQLRDCSALTHWHAVKYGGKVLTILCQPALKVAGADVIVPRLHAHIACRVIKARNGHPCRRAMATQRSRVICLTQDALNDAFILARAGAEALAYALLNKVFEKCLLHVALCAQRGSKAGQVFCVPPLDNPSCHQLTVKVNQSSNCGVFPNALKHPSHALNHVEVLSV